MWLREVCDALEVWLLEELAELVVCVVGELEFGEELMAVEFGVLDGWVVDVGVCVLGIWMMALVVRSFFLYLSMLLKSVSGMFMERRLLASALSRSGEVVELKWICSPVALVS